MDSPNELEGEVDHSFFDSNYDASRTDPVTRVHQEKEEDRGGANKELPDQAEDSRIKSLETKEAEKEESGVETLEKEMSRLEVESRLIGSRSDDSSSVGSSSSAGEDDDDDVFKNEDDGYRRSETPEESPSKFRNRSRSRLSSSRSTERSPSPLVKRSTSRPSLSPWRLLRPGSAKKQSSKTLVTDDSNDTLADVTPLPSPDINPQQSPSTPTTSPLPDTLDTMYGQQLNENTDGQKESGVRSAGRQMDRALLLPSPCSTSFHSSRSGTSRRCKNFSFSTDEVQRIRRENQRLLNKLSRSSNQSSSRSTHRFSAPACRLYHSAVNRQREQQRIQQQNLAFIKRLESVKATPGMARLEQLTDYQRQASYLGNHSSERTTGTCSTTRRSEPETSKLSRPAWS